VLVPINQSEFVYKSRETVQSLDTMSVQRVPLFSVADEILLALLKHMPEPWRLAVCKSLRAFLCAQDGTHNNPKLTARVKVNGAAYLSSNVHGKDDQLLAALHQHCGRYAVQDLQLSGLKADFHNANLGRVLWLTPGLTILDLTNTQLRLDSFADALGQLTDMHTLRLSGNTDFRHSTSHVNLTTALTALELYDCRLGETSLQMMMALVDRCPGLALRRLNLAANNFAEADSLSLLLTKLTALTSIDLSMTGLNGRRLRQVMRALAGCTALEVLRLAGLPVNDPSKLRYPRRYTQAEVNLETARNKILFDSFGRLPRLKCLSLNYMHVGANADALATALSFMPKMEVLILDGIEVGSAGATSIAGALFVMQSLKRVNMLDVAIGSDGARAIVAAVAGRTTLVELNLTGDNFRMNYL